MKPYFKIFFLLIATISNAQKLGDDIVHTNCSDKYIREELSNAKELFQIVENPPYYGVCQELITTKENSYECSDYNVRNFLIEQGIVESQKKITQNLKIQFVVEKEGCLSQIQVLTNTTTFSSSEIVKKIKQMINWEPGTQNDKVVRVLRTIDVKQISNKR